MPQPTQPQREETDEPSTRVNRRAVMKAAGTAGAGLVAIGATAGTAAAKTTPDQLYFCGCSQVVVTGLGADASITVYLRATEEGGCRTVTVDSPDCFVGGGREYAFRYTVQEGEAILAVETPDGNIWCNPNNCAQKWIDDLECFFEDDTLRDRCTDPDEELDPPQEVFTSGCDTVCNDG